MVNAEIVSIGSELLLGQIVDTNAAWMAQRLTDSGVNLFYKTVVGDNPTRMGEVIGRALERSDVVITGGGIGPTQDDLTREIIAKVTGRELVLDPISVERIERRFRDRGLIMTPNNERQAYIPNGATTIGNPNGTAPAFVVEDPRGVIFAMPGVPFEMKWLFDNEVLPYLRSRFSLAETITSKVLKVAEIGESSVDDRIGHLIAKSSNPTVGVLAHPGQVDVRIAAKAPNTEDAMKLIAPVEDEVREPAWPAYFRRRRRDDGARRGQAASAARRDRCGVRGPHRGPIGREALSGRTRELRRGGHRQTRPLALAGCSGSLVDRISRTVCWRTPSHLQARWRGPSAPRPRAILVLLCTRLPTPMGKPRI